MLNQGRAGVYMHHAFTVIICWLQFLIWVTFLLLPYTSKRTEAGPVKPKQPGLKVAMSTISSAGAKKIGGMALLNRFQSSPLKVSECKLVSE